MEAVELRAIWNVIRNGDDEKLEKRIPRRIQTKTNQEIQATEKKSMNQFCKYYK